MIDADPVASCVREIVARRKNWKGTAAELLSLGLGSSGDRLSWRSWPKNPRALAGRLRRAQTALRSLGIEIVFTREGNSGTRIINITSAGKSPLPEHRDGEQQSMVGSTIRPMHHRPIDQPVTEHRNSPVELDPHT
jgi:hypothetical protein